jgi:hypothetical protein
MMWDSWWDNSSLNEDGTKATHWGGGAAFFEIGGTDAGERWMKEYAESGALGNNITGFDVTDFGKEQAHVSYYDA